VALVRSLRRSAGLNFKQRLLFTKLTALPGLKNDPRLLAALDDLAQGYRRWLGLELLPDLLAKACQVLERSGARPKLELARFKRLFIKKVKTAERVLYQGLRDHLAASKAISSSR
jgi:hypothetical protein